MALLLVSALGILVADGLTFAVVGDWGTGGYKARNDWEIRSAQMLNEVCGKIKCNFTISCGDNIYVGNVMQGLHDSFEEMFDLSSGPFFPVPGNHDNVGPQLEYAKNHPRWRFDNRFYNYKIPIDNTGYAVELFAVDTTDGSLGGGAQYHWLENKLYESTARWKFIFGHYPTTGSGRHKRVGSVGRITALMQKYNAQAYFFGHDHIVEISNHEGRIYGLSGGMSRGGMMMRGIGGSLRKFTLTTPNEWNQYRQDWGEHGFITGELSPNVLTLSVWFHVGGVQYEFAVTHDWQAQAANMSSKEREQWPSGAIILKALKEELTLPKGQEVGDAIKWVGTEMVRQDVPRTPNPPTPAPTPAPLVNGTTATPAPTQSTAAPRTVVLSPSGPNATIPLDKILDVHAPEPHPPGQAMYAVSAECDRCPNRVPVIHEPFTITIQDYDIMGAMCRIFLTTSATGCFDPSKRLYLEGTGGIHPLHSNTFVTNSTVDYKTVVYVCLSTDGGQTYERLRRVNDPNEPASFVLGLPDYGAALSAPIINSGPTPGANGSAPPSSPTGNTGGDTGHSLGTLIMVGVGCLVMGLVGSQVSKKLFPSS
jgi:hypothetical protein